jgi:hypothetical protein
LYLAYLVSAEADRQVDLIHTRGNVLKKRAANSILYNLNVGRAGFLSNYSQLPLRAVL